MLRERGACWSGCLKTGHRLRDCRSRKACCENVCTRTHHRTFFFYFRVRTGKGWANVMWYNAESLSFITNNKSKAEVLHGTRVDISIVGGTSETVMSNRCLVPLIDSQGQVVLFEVYGIDVITPDIQGVSVNNVVHLFKDVAPEEMRRPTGSVDVLMGYGYARYHPVPEQKSGHL